MVVIWTSSLTTFLAGLIFLFYISEGPFAFARTRFDPLQIIQVLRRKSFNLVNVGYVGHMWDLYAMWAWILTFARFSEQSFEVFLFGTPEYFSFFIISIGAVGCLIAGRLSDVYGRCYTTAILMLVSGASAFSIGIIVAISPVLFTAVALLWGKTIFADSGQFSTAVTQSSVPHLVGQAPPFLIPLGFRSSVLTISSAHLPPPRIPVL